MRRSRDIEAGRQPEPSVYRGVMRSEQQIRHAIGTLAEVRARYLAKGRHSHAADILRDIAVLQWVLGETESLHGWE